MQKDQLSLLYPLVVAICFLNLLMWNQLMTLWSGAEANVLLAARYDYYETLRWPIKWWRYIGEAAEWRLEYLRLFSVAAVIAGIALSYYLLKRLAGTATALLVIAVMSTSWGLLFIGKTASLDSFLLLGQVMAFFGLLHYLKRPSIGWQFLFWAGAILSMVVAPIQSMLLLLGLGLGWRFLHPSGKNMDRLSIWAVPLVAGALYWLQWSDSVVFQWAGFGNWQLYLLLFVVGTLPFAGFVLAGVRHLFSQWQKKEEFAIIMGIGILASLLTMSPLLSLLLAWLVARHLRDYFIEKYPYRSIARGGSILHLVLVFCLATFFMMYLAFYYPGSGFRAGAALMLYWILSLVVVVGLYRPHQGMVYVGTLLGAGLAFSLFWFQIMPLIDIRKNLDKELGTLIGRETTTTVHIPEGYVSDVARYASGLAPMTTDRSTVQNSWNTAESGLYFLPSGMLASDQVDSTSTYILTNRRLLGPPDTLYVFRVE